ncbi:MAG: M13 family metallopeptidase [Ferruginibacter sp.]
MKMSTLLLFACCFFILQKSNAQTSKKFIDPANMDLTVKPGDNFYLYVNGNWIKNTVIPASKTRWGSFDQLSDESSKSLKALLEEAATYQGSSSLMKRVGDYYASSMDTNTINKLGYLPIKGYLNKIAAIKTKAEVISMVAYLRANAISSPLINIGVRQDAKNVSKYIVSISQGGTSLPDRDYYLKNDPRSKSIREAFTDYIIKSFMLTGKNEISAKAEALKILQLETSIANAQLSRVQMRDPVKLYNKMAVRNLREKTPHLPWPVFFKGLGYATPVDTVIVAQPAFVYFTDSLLNAVPLNDWKAYLQWNIIKDNATGLSSDFVNANFDFNKVLTGQKEQTPRWERMSNLIDRQLGELLGQLYVQKYFKPEAKKRMQALVANMQKTYESRIKKLEWMSDDTKLRALQKLNAYVNKIGYPDKWKDYQGVVIKRNDFSGNIRSAAKWQYNDMLARLNKPVDKTEWGMTPPTVNAYYSPQRNEIVFPAGILRAPFFDADADDALNYGGIAAVIGHEISHGFDDQGRQFDGDGNLKDWWTKSDADEFKKRTDRIVEQYNAFTILDTIHVNGRLTLGENIADLGGLSIAYEAFKNTDQGKANAVIDGFTADQRFFINWAQVWRSNVLPETAAQRILTDSHSPGMYRANAPLTNIDAFYKTFDIKEGDKMYVAPEERIRVW